VGPGAQPYWHCRRVGDGLAYGGVLPSRDDVCGADEYVFRATGRSAAPIAVVTFCAALVSPWAAMLPGAATALLLHGVTGVIGRVSAVRAADLRVPGPVWWVALLAVLGWAFCCWAVRRSRGWAWVSVVMLPSVAMMVLWPEPAVSSPGSLEVTAIDVDRATQSSLWGQAGRRC